jgi:hypothetical protein
MRLLYPKAVAETKIAVTGTATSLYDLMETASGSISGLKNYYSSMGGNAVLITPEDGDIRIINGGDPTASVGTLLLAGVTYWIPCNLSTLNLIRTSSPNVNCSLHIGVAAEGEGFSAVGAGSGGSINVEVGGSSQASGLAVYYAKPSGGNGDGVSAYASATTLTVTGLPFTLNAEDIESIEQIPTSGDSTLHTDKADFAVSSGTITVTGAAFATSDVFVVKITGPTRSYVPGTNTDRTTETNPLDQKYIVETHILTNVANATPEFVYIDMDGFRGVSVHVEKTGGTDTFDTDYESSVEGSDSSDDWLETTTNWTFVAGSATADHIAVPSDPKFIPRGHRVELTTAGGSDDADFQVSVKKFY